MGAAARRRILVRPLLGRGEAGGVGAVALLICAGMAPAATLLVSQTLPAQAAARWSLEAMLGAAANLPTSLRIQQAGFPTLDFAGHYETHPFEPSLYYTLRVARWGERSAWALELVHHKLYLEDPPPEVQTFAISHGFNLFTLDRLWRRRDDYWGVGVGAVIAHAENTIRGRRLDEHRGALKAGYELAGPTVGVLGGHDFALGTSLGLSAEIKLTAARARVAVAGGHAVGSNLAAHLAAGIRWRAREPR